MEELKTRFKQLIEKLGYYLYDLEYVKEDGERILRVLIENDSRITLDDCVIVSEKLGESLDENDPFDEPYQLEVSSAGAERVLHNSEQIERHIGEFVHIETFEQHYDGILKDYQDGNLTLELKNKKKVKVHDMDVQLIRLAIMI
jgi:ribosome maturation factor RimP